MKGIYCGAKSEPPKGSILGSMLDCAKSNQIRRFGLFKADDAMINYKEGRKKVKNKRLKYIKKIALLTSKINRYTQLINLTGSQSKTPKAKADISLAKSELPKLKEEYKKNVKEFNKLPK